MLTSWLSARKEAILKPRFQTLAIKSKFYFWNGLFGGRNHCFSAMKKEIFESKDVISHG